MQRNLLVCLPGLVLKVMSCSQRRISDKIAKSPDSILTNCWGKKYEQDYMLNFYRTQVNLGSDSWVRMSVSE